MKLFKKILHVALVFIIIFCSAFSSCVFAGGDNESGFSFGFGEKIGEPVFKDKQEDIMFDKPLKWGKTEILGVECDWEKTDSIASFLEKQREAQAKLICGILTDNIDLVNKAMETNLIDLTSWVHVITNSENEEEKQQMFIFKDELLKHPLVAKHLETAYNLAEQKHFLFMPPKCSASQTEFTKMPGLFGDQYVVISETNIERVRTPFLIDKTVIIGIRTCERFSNNGLEDFVKALISGNFGMVKSSVEKYNIDPRFAVLLVSAERYELRLNPIYEARIRGYKEIEKYLSEVSGVKHEEQTKRIQKAWQLSQDEHNKWLITSDEYVRFDSPIEWKYFLDRLTTKIWGINKTDLDENEWGIIVPPTDVPGAVVKSPEQIKNEELLIRGVLEDNVDMVRLALDSKLINKNLLISVVTGEQKAKRFNVIQEALNKNNAEIISLLREYQYQTDI